MRPGSALRRSRSDREAGADREDDHRGDREPSALPVRGETQRQRDRHARQIRDHERAPAIEPIGDHAGDRRRDEHGQHRRRVDEGRRSRSPRSAR